MESEQFTLVEQESLYSPEKINEITKIKEQFKIIYGNYPEIGVRAPGEHIDYHGYEGKTRTQDIVILVGKSDDNTVKIHNTSSTYEPTSAKIDNLIDSKSHKWYNYFLSGVKGVLEYCKIKDNSKVGFNALVYGTIPASAGLSSSSALVCAAALATNSILNLNLSRSELASICAESEKYVGTQGGGMDQAISFLGSKGTAKLIYFNPLKCISVNLPSNAMFVIANSLVEASKAVDANAYFNLRVAEGRLAAVLLAKLLNLPSYLSIKKLKEVQVQSGKTILQMIEFIELHIHKEPYSLEELAQILQLNTDDTAKIYNNTSIVAKKFFIYNRAKHVYSEAYRVHKFYEILNSGSYDNQLKDLGNLMNDSHNSCNVLYDCSCDNLNVLTSLSVQYGAYGSRLTGAGWGGCTISLLSCESSNFLENIQTNYYEKQKLKSENAMFITFPGAGAQIFKV